MKVHLSGVNPYPSSVWLSVYLANIKDDKLKEAGLYYLSRVSDIYIKSDFMKIFLAGGVSGNLRNFWLKVIKIYQASPCLRDEVVEALKSYIYKDIMKGYLAGCASRKNILYDKVKSSYGVNKSEDRKLY